MTKSGEAICPNCYAANPAASAFCSICGSKINTESNSATFIEKHKPATSSISLIRMLGIFVFICVVAWVFHWVANGGLYKSNISESDASSETTEPGTERLLNARELAIVYLGTSKEALMEFVKTVQAKDEIGLQQLILSRRLFTVQKNTRALILESNYPFLKVRVLEGPHITEAGWIDSTWVK
jgi:hypothetical protein